MLSHHLLIAPCAWLGLAATLFRLHSVHEPERRMQPDAGGRRLWGNLGLEDGPRAESSPRGFEKITIYTAL